MLGGSTQGPQCPGAAPKGALALQPPGCLSHSFLASEQECRAGAASPEGSVLRAAKTPGSPLVGTGGSHAGAAGFECSMF